MGHYRPDGGSCVRGMIVESKQKAAERAFIGRWVQIDSSGKKGRITSVAVTSDGYVIGHTKPGFDRGVFLGRAPDKVE